MGAFSPSCSNLCAFEIVKVAVVVWIAHLLTLFEALHLGYSLYYFLIVIVAMAGEKDDSFQSNSEQLNGKNHSYWNYGECCYCK